MLTCSICRARCKRLDEGYDFNLSFIVLNTHIRDPGVPSILRQQARPMLDDHGIKPDRKPLNVTISQFPHGSSRGSCRSFGYNAVRSRCVPASRRTGRSRRRRKVTLEEHGTHQSGVETKDTSIH